jgi:hypothetical protein
LDAPGAGLEALENEELVGRSGTLRHDPKAGLNVFRF